MRNRLYEDQDFLLEYEYNKNGCLFAHCKVHNYNKTVKKRIDFVWRLASKTLNVPRIYMATDNEQTKKFVKMFNFSYLTTVDGYDVFLYKVI